MHVPIKSEWINFAGSAGYLALPERAAAPLPGVLVIAEVWGVDEHIEEVTRRLASAGYAALAPDFFIKTGGVRPASLARERIAEVKSAAARLAPGSLFNPALRDGELAKLPEPEQGRVRETIGELFGGLSQMQDCLGPLRAAIRHLRTELPQTRGQKVACVGFCMGGGLSALLACEEPELSGAAVYYGNLPSAGQAAGIQCPVIGFFGAKDVRVNAGLPAFVDTMQALGKPFEHHIYPEAAHGFFNDTRATYAVNAVRASYARLLAFFSQHLTG